MASKAARNFRYYRNCVGWPPGDVDATGGLSDLIRMSVQITRGAFLKRVHREDLRELERQLGYSKHPSKGLTMAGDYHVQYFRSKHQGIRVYGFTHSAIEYVFKCLDLEGRVIALQQTIPFPEFRSLGKHPFARPEVGPAPVTKWGM